MKHGDVQKTPQVNIADPNGSNLSAAAAEEAVVDPEEGSSARESSSVAESSTAGGLFRSALVRIGWGK